MVQIRDRKNTKLFLLFSMALTSQSFASRLISLIKPTVPGVDIPNAHEITPYIYRGMEPIAAEVTQYLQGVLHITDILDIEWTNGLDYDDPNNDLKEKQLLGGLNYNLVQPEDAAKPLPPTAEKPWRYYIAPTKWDSLEPFADHCKYFLRALRVLKVVNDDPTQSRKLYFHCTVGEDRTGTLAALFRLLAQNWALNVAFAEMCTNGYEAGDPKKALPEEFDRVIVPIRAQLTPFFLKMVYKIKTGALTWDNISDDACAEDPSTLPDFQTDFYNAANYTCKTSEFAEALPPN